MSKDTEKKYKKLFGRILWGVFLIGLGVILILKNQGMEFSIFFTGWWTLFIIIPSVGSILTEDDKTGGFVGLALGVLLLLGARGIIDYGNIWKYLLPIILISIGLDVIFRHRDDDED
ncbi:MAG: hypothetical protein KBS81_07510 [Spirochaetales bacterium]|nr:hypothetical protein [Candidatus Physcosoma equi]